MLVKVKIQISSTVTIGSHIVERDDADADEAAVLAAADKAVKEIAAACSSFHATVTGVAQE